MTKKYSKDLLTFIEQSSSVFHNIKEIKKRLFKHGYQELEEKDSWTLEKGSSYFTTRNNSSIIAFHIGKEMKESHFQITAAHSDSPTFKLKAKPVLTSKKDYLVANIESYGGMIDYSWFDRPLSLSGRVFVDKKDRVDEILLSIEKDLFLIPSVAIHMGLENKGEWNIQKDLLPLISCGKVEENDFLDYIAKEVGSSKEDLLSFDLYLVNRQKGSIWGLEEEFISSPKLDDLQCVYSSLQALLESKDEKHINVFAVFDNEEVGSLTKQAAMSTFLRDSLQRIHTSFASCSLQETLAKSFMVSCDNAHAIHPNHPELSDPMNFPQMNKGIVIKENSQQKYMTDAFSRAVFTKLCKDAHVPYQTYANRSDKKGGSTLGNLATVHTSIQGIDIGLSQLAMHSSYETAGSLDTDYMICALKEFFNRNILLFSHAFTIE